MSTRLLSSSPKLFCPEEANKTLPLVSAILTDLVPLWKAVAGCQRRIKHLTQNRVDTTGNPYSEELGAMQDKLQADSLRVESLIDELREIGIEFKGSSKKANCHACFPAMHEGRLVYLSWQLGEPEVCHWIELDGELEQRRSLLVSASE